MVHAKVDVNIFLSLAETICKVGFVAAWLAWLSIRFGAKALGHSGGSKSSCASTYYLHQIENNGLRVLEGSFRTTNVPATSSRFSKDDKEENSGMKKLRTILVGLEHSACNRFCCQRIYRTFNFSALYWPQVFVLRIAAATVTCFGSTIWSSCCCFRVGLCFTMKKPWNLNDIWVTW